MSRNTWLVVGIALLIALGSPMTGEAKKKTRDRQSAKKTAENKLKEKDRRKTEQAQKEFEKWRQEGREIELPENVGSMTDVMAELGEKVGLTEQQKKKIGEMRAVRDKALERWDKANRKNFDAVKAQLDKLSAGKGTRTCKAIVGRLNAMRKAHASIATGYERKMFEVLTAEQRAKWNAPILSKLLMQEFSSLELSEAQTAKIDSACNARAKRCSFPLGGNTSAQTAASLKKYVYSSILTAKQRKEYAATKKQEKAGDRNR